MKKKKFNILDPQPGDIQTEAKELQDYTGTLEELSFLVERLKKQYGKNTVIYTDAGYNNVSFELIVRK